MRPSVSQTYIWKAENIWAYTQSSNNSPLSTVWTVGCCLNLHNNQVVGAFGVMGDNSFNKKVLNELMMSEQNVAYVEWALKLEDPTIKLFPDHKGKDCYKQEKKR